MISGTSLVTVAFAPLVPWAVIWAIGAVAAALILFGAFQRARGTVLRTLAIGAGLAALANPAIIQEEREPVSDVVAVVVDRSLSQNVGDRTARTDQALAQITEQLAAFENVEVRVIPAAGNTGDNVEGTALFDAIEQALSDVPPDRVAGMVLITDGQVHDAPDVAAMAEDSPVHVLVTGARNEGDRRLVVVQAPSYGVVGHTLQMTVRIEDTAAAANPGNATLEIITDGGEVQRFLVPVGRDTDLALTLEHAGQTVLELATPEGPQELTLNNNRAAVVVNGVRDRLRVMLISGEPHAGERTWRSLLKADPSVDLVHFTILRPPEKQDATPIRELSLIAFPIRQLFEEKISDFDLIIFDRYRRRGVIPQIYMQNIAQYVAEGGAVLEAAGPAFASPLSLYGTPLAAVLPGAPIGTVTEGGFRPQIADLGNRHPVTADLAGPANADPDWGRWFRIIDADASRGDVLMEDEQGRPLLILDRVGEGRVAQLMSDQAWLWARGFEGGGPQAELLRRLAHWLMKEPDLEEESLTATGISNRLEITRRSLDPAPPPQVTVTGPDGETYTVELAPTTGGRSEGVLAVDTGGLYRVTDGKVSAIAAVGTLNPLEFDDLRATDAVLAPIAAATGGGVFWLAENGIPDARQVRAGRTTKGESWMGFPDTQTYVITGVAQASLMPALLVLMLVLGGLLAAWYREGH
jgi:hypothetical protein